MTITRRITVLIGLTVAVIVGASLPASAAFADSVTVPTTVTTINVAAPSTVTVTGNCQGWWYTATITWSASTTPRGVTGYRVLAYLNDGTVSVVGETNAATRSMSLSVDSSNLGYQPRVAIVTLTSYGWTAESAKTGVISC
jgi:hypothetical protein